jgi:hypothetical protein
LKKIIFANVIKGEKLMRTQDLKFSVDKHIVLEFQEVFKVPLYRFCDLVLTKFTGEFKIDLVKFDYFLHKWMGYSEDLHGSIGEFLTLLAGKEFSDAIRTLL